MSRFCTSVRMSSSSSKNRLRLASEIKRHGHPAEVACNRCFLNGHNCIIMEGKARLKCSECVRIGRPCVNMSWSSLDRTREKLQQEIDEDEEELSRVMARLLRKKKLLRQADERAKKKALCLANEMEESGELDALEDCPAAAIGTAVSPAVWESLSWINSALDSGETVEGVDGSS